jgi:hypothetical protein
MSFSMAKGLTIFCMPALYPVSFLFEECRYERGLRVKVSTDLIFNAEGKLAR